MSFWGKALDFGSQALGTTLGSAAGGYASDTAMGMLNKAGNSRKENRKNFHQDMEQQWVWDTKRANLGRDIDVGAQQEMFDFRMQRGKDAGMTDYEMFMGPAAGAGGGTGSATQTLGNGGTAAANQLRQAQSAEKIASEEKQKDRITSLAQTAMQTDAQKDVAKTQAGVAERGQDIQKLIAEGKLELDRDTYKYISLPQAAQQLQKTEQETAKLINEVATSEKKFVTLMKQLSMGVDNVLVEYYQRHHGISLSDPQSWTKLPKQKREALLSQMIALGSNTRKEFSGISATIGNLLDSVSGAGSDLMDLPSILGNGIEPATGATVPGRGRYQNNRR